MNKKESLKVLELNAVFSSGSTGIIMQEIGTVLEKSGHRVFYAIAENYKKGKNIYTIGNQFDHKKHALLCRVFGLQGYYSKRATKKLLKWIEEIEPDIIHVHNLHSNYINYPYLFKYVKEKEIRTVITLHDCWFFTGKCFHFLYNECQRWKKECGKCPRIHCEQNSIFFDRTRKVIKDKRKFIGLNEYVTVVAVSDWLNRIAQQSILKERDIITIKNGIDIETFNPKNVDKSNYGIPERKFIIMGMANKWLANENTDTFFEITNFLEEDERLLLIGCNEKQLKHLPPNVIGVGFVAEKKILCDYYSLSDIFVNVTKVDSLPTVNIEALACGTPVITYNSGGSAEIINPNVGACVEYGDISGLKDAIRLIKKQGKKYYSNKCKDHILKNYQKDMKYNEYVKLFERLSGETREVLL